MLLINYHVALIPELPYLVNDSPAVLIRPDKVWSLISWGAGSQPRLTVICTDGGRAWKSVY